MYPRSMQYVLIAVTWPISRTVVAGVSDLWNLVQVIPTRQYAGLVMISCELTNPNKNVSQMYLFSDIASMLNARAEISTDGQVRRPVFDTRLIVDPEGAVFFAIKTETDRKSTRLNSSHVKISYAVICLKKKKNPMDN